MPAIGRRAFILFGLGTVGTGLLSTTETTASARERPAIPAGPTRSRFARAVGSVFLATSGNRKHRLRLMEIIDVGRSAPAGDEHAFNLLFAPVSGSFPSERIYLLTGAGVPATTLFASPVGRPGNDRRLQALVNNPVRSA